MLALYLPNINTGVSINLLVKHNQNTFLIKPPQITVELYH